MNYFTSNRKVSKVYKAAGACRGFPVLFFCIFFTGCLKQKTAPVERSFYYWKSRLLLSAKETQALEQLKVTKLYIKFFDVDWDAEKADATPVAKIDTDSASLEKLRRLQINIIPVVFITNKTLQQTDAAALQKLSANLLSLINLLCEKNKISHIKELQVDCDWTQTTKENYFKLLENIKQQLKNSPAFEPHALLSATIRLHQVKYSSKTGVPPVDKGLLMCYNMGNLKNAAARNSIFDPEEMKKYLAGLKTYSLPLDIALPLFEWNVLFSNGSYKGIVSNINTSELTGCGRKTGNDFIFSADTIIRSVSFQKGDRLRSEKSNGEEIRKAIHYLKKQLPNNQNFTLSFYHLDELILNKHPANELETLYNSFH